MVHFKSTTKKINLNINGIDTGVMNNIMMKAHKCNNGGGSNVKSKLQENNTKQIKTRGDFSGISKFITFSQTNRGLTNVNM